MTDGLVIIDAGGRAVDDDPACRFLKPSSDDAPV